MAVLAFALALASVLAAAPAQALNPIATENQLPGNPPSEWDVSGAGDLSIQGFATDISVNRGGTIGFKVSTNAAQYQIRIYRLGYYQGNGARLITTLGPFTGASQSIPTPDPVTGLVDCGGWALATTWSVPGTAVSGIYIARLVRLDTQGASHIAFVVRDDASTSSLLFKTSDATWQAYNAYGGNSLYVGTAPFPSGHAAKVSYNRPFLTRAGGGGGGAAEDWLFNAEYPMVRWLEANGYDVSYTTDVDADRFGSLILNHDVFLSVGHDEYWSAAERANVLAARDAGVHLAFFSGNEVYWKTRWETSVVDGTPYRTLVCYKEGTLGENACGGKCDPLPNTWTGLWRDGCAFSPPADGCSPENALTGQISWGLGDAGLEVSDAYRNHRFWRSTSVASLGTGQSTTLGSRVLGYEYDLEQYESSYPASRVPLSFTDIGGNVHRLSLYRAPSGALVFGAGTVQWSWGLDSNHDRGNDPPVTAIRQATVNLFADMGVLPETLQPGLTPATPSNDPSPPASAITSPLSGASLPAGTPVAISGTATEAGGGIVVAVDVSTDGGATWARATGTTSWTYNWTPLVAGSANLRVRALDDLGNLETPGAGITVTVTGAPPAVCPCTVFLPTETPAQPDLNDGTPIEVGMKFRATVDGEITGVRFYKGPANTGTHTGHLWSAAGVQLAEVVFTGESASGWQQASFPSPVPITAGQTYVVSYHSGSGGYASDSPYFTNAVLRPPLRALGNGEDGPNGVYRYGASGFPTDAFNASNYWVDVVFQDDTGPAPPVVTSTTPASNATGVSSFAPVFAVFNEALDPTTVSTATFELRDAGSTLVPATVSWDAGNRTATLTPGTALAHNATYTARLKGGTTDPRIKDLEGNALVADYVWSFTISGPDVSPPVVLATLPSSGAIGVPGTTTVDVVFDELMDPATLNATTFELRDASNALIPASVSFNIYTHTAVLTPITPLVANATYTARVRGGGADPRAKDLAGNPLATDYTWSFSTSAGFGCPCTVFQPTDVPASADVSDGVPIELGMKFRATTAGYVTGVRFYKGVTNVGTHIGHLWSAAGVMLAEATFVGESASGWQQVDFASPVAITANTTYVVSYHTPAVFAVNTQYFGSAVVNDPLRGLADGEDGPNGVFVYSATPAFPNQAGSPPFNQSNYWVDVVFATEIGPDLTPPTVTAVDPPSGGAGVLIGANAIATFSEPLDPATVTTGTATIRQGANPPLAATVTWGAAARSVTIDPTAPLAYSTTYTVTLEGGGVEPTLKDVAGNPLAADYTWSFTTQAPPPPPPDQGPGGPILVVSDSGDPFTRYYAEILRCEGLNAFRVRDLSLTTQATLDSHEVVILAATTLSGPQVTMITDWVNAGGDLIAIRPDAALAGLLGLSAPSGTLTNTYLRVDTLQSPGLGIVGQTMQFHGSADRWTLSGATAVATLYTDASTATSNPAVTLRSVGSNGGTASAFTYDLARSIVYTRQGNPAWAGQERDGSPPRRSNDLFYGAAAGDPQPDWIDLDKVAIPQADEQQRLLVNLIQHVRLGRGPLPRLWYFPRNLKAVVVHTGDNHASSGTPIRFDTNLGQSPPGCSVPDWECVRSTSYLYAGAPLTDAQVQQYEADGFEIGLHINTGCVDWTPSSLDADITNQTAAAQALYPSMDAQTTNRTHCIAWSDWSSQADIQAAHGIRLDTNYYYWPPGWVNNRPGMFTGSAMPMRFARLDGSMVDCFQLATQMTDESGQAYPFTIDALLDRALGPEGFYGAFCTNIHLDGSSETLNDQIVASALARGVPVITAKQMLEWTDGRNASTFSNFTWNGADLGFALAVGAGARNLRAMLPAQQGGAALQSLTLGGTPVAYTTETIKGIAYAVFPGNPGNYVASYFQDVTGPVITDLTATPGTDGTAQITWTTNEPSTSRVDYGTSPGSLGLNVSNGVLVTAHTVTLTGLSASTTYHFRVTSVDASSNPTVAPNPPADPATFVTPDPPCAQDLIAADFAAGTHTGTTVTETSGGEVMLAPFVGAEFFGTALPAEWISNSWGGGGGSTVAGGLVSVDGHRANHTVPAAFGVGHTLEFSATFSGQSFQHIGFAAGSDAVGPGGMYWDPPFVMFTTYNTTGSLYVRTYGSSDTVVPLGPGLTGTRHLFRIDWKPDSVVYWVDGARVSAIATVLATPMRVGISDLSSGGGTVDVDWIRVTPYGTTGTFVSRVFDAGAPSSWGAATWSSILPAGTAIAMSARRGNTPVPDTTWTAFQPIVSSGDPVGGLSRYLQYRAELSTSDLQTTPALLGMSVACGPCGEPTPPAAIANLASVATGNAGGGRSNVRLSWSGVTAGHTVAVYRKAFGDYPLYRDGTGAVPQAPASPAAAVSEGWTLTGVTASDGLDAPPTRGLWYHVAFVTNTCGLVSGVSNRAGGTLDYQLGDVSNGTAVCAGSGEAGDVSVTTADLSALGAQYGQSFPDTDSRVCLDVGPTVDGGPRSRPVPDGALDFEDFVIYALNYNVPLAPQASAKPAVARGPAKTAAASDALFAAAPTSVRAGDVFDVTLRFTGTGAVHALSADLAWDAAVASIAGVSAGPALEDAGGVAMAPRPGTVDLAVLGASSPGLTGDGVVATVRFRALRDGEPRVRLAEVRARDAGNRPVSLGTTTTAAAPVVPHTTALGAVFPNPFHASLNVSFALARESRVRVTVYDLAGRVVRHVEDGPRTAGFHVVSWDGRADAGSPAPSGVYMIRFETGEVVQTRRVQLVR